MGWKGFFEKRQNKLQEEAVKLHISCNEVAMKKAERYLEHLEELKSRRQAYPEGGTV